MVPISHVWRSWTVLFRQYLRAIRWVALPALLLLWPGVAAAQSSAVTQEANIASGGMAGSFSLGRPQSTVQGRFLKLEAMVKF